MSDYIIEPFVAAADGPMPWWIVRASLHSDVPPTEGNRIADLASTHTEALPGMDGHIRITWTFDMLPDHRHPQVIVGALWDQNGVLRQRIGFPFTAGQATLIYEEAPMPLLEDDHGQTWLSPVRDVSPAHPDASA